MTNFNQISKKYYRRAKHNCPLSHREKNYFIAELKDTLQMVYSRYTVVIQEPVVVESRAIQE